MGFVRFLINKLAGYDVNAREKALQNALRKEKENSQFYVNQLRNRLSAAEEEKTDSNNLIQRLRAENNDLQRENTESNNLVQRLRTENNNLQQEKTSLSTQIEESNNNATHLGNQLKAYKANFTRAKDANEKLKTKYEKEIEELKESLKKSTDAFDTTKKEKDSIHELLTEKQLELNQKEAEIRRLNDLLANMDDTRQQNVPNNDEIRELENQIQDLQEQVSDHKREIEIKNSELKQKEAEIREIGEALSKANDSIKQLEDKIADASTLINNKENEIKRLKETVETLEKSEGENQEENQNPENQPEHISLSEPPMGRTPNNGPEDTNEGDSEPVEVKTEPTEVGTVPETKPSIRKRKTKAEKAIENSQGSMLDFPAIVNDSSREVKRSIKYILDKNDQRIDADTFFKSSAEEIALKSRELEEARLMKSRDFICGMCHRPVRIAHRTFNGRESLFFAHATKNEHCPWITYNNQSKDDEYLIDEFDLETTSNEAEEILKEKIFSLLCTPESEELGITDVKCNAIIRSDVPYMKWRRPDISFKYNNRNVVILLQREEHDLHMLVDRDVFFRLNNYHVIWVFGADNDITYEYMRNTTFKNTLFDCHRNVFVFDKEAQQRSEEKNTLCLKYNWLDENDKWAFTILKTKSNGLIADITDFIFDDEYCKPYIKEANEPYFNLHPEARERYFETEKSREQLLKEFEDKWKHEPSYEEALRQMRLRGDKATPFQYMGFWGFQFRKTVLLQPIFTEEPIDLTNGFFMVKQGVTAGVVNYRGEVIMDWKNLECDMLSVDEANERVMFQKDGSYGVADYMGNILIKPNFDDIAPWSDAIYRVRMNNLWGLHHIEDTTVVQCVYDSIGELVSTQAEAILRDKDKSWITYKGMIDSNGQPIDTNVLSLNNGYIAFERFSKWGIRSSNGKEVIESVYEKILPWDDNAVRVQSDRKWGVINILNSKFILPAKYDSISELKDGRSTISYIGVINVVDAQGNFIAEESVILQDGFVKSKIGGKWGIEKFGKVIVQHKYDEIGSFRQRLIGVINSSIVKLNAYYDYPIRIKGKCRGFGKEAVKVDISGVTCYIPNTFIKNARLEGKIHRGYICNDIAFSNLIFSHERYILKFISEAQMKKKTSHGDKETDYSMNEIVSGTITDIMRYKTLGDKLKTTKVKVRITDGRETMIPRRFFIAAGLDITDFSKGDTIRIQKIGFDDELDQTTWEIKEAHHKNSKSKDASVEVEYTKQGVIVTKTK